VANFDFNQYLSNIDAEVAAINPTSIADDKFAKLQERTAKKRNKLDVVSDIYDADTYTLRDDPSSTRALGIDTYETTKGQSWFNNPRNVNRIQEQQALLSVELGRPASVQDVFAAGNAQAASAKEILGAGTSYSNLPAIVESYQEVNPNPFDKSPRNNYGRNLGVISTIGGKYSLPDDTVVDGITSIGKMPLTPTKASSTEAYASLIKSDSEGRIGETIDIAQAAVAKFGADTVNMLENLVGKENIAKYDAWASEVEKSLGGDGKAGIFIDEDSRKTIEGIRDTTTAQREFGVSEETINEHNTAMQESAELWKNADNPVDYIKSLAHGMSQLDRILAGSAGEILSLGIPGGPAVVAATRTSNYAEEYEKNNNKPMSKGKLAQTFFTEIAVLVPEKLLIKSGISDIVKKTADGTKSGVIKRITKSGGGEFLQEGAEAVSEAIATQKEGERSVLDIVTDPETAHQAAIGFGMGAALKGGGEVLGRGAEIVGGKTEAAVDKAKNLATKAKEAVRPGHDTVTAAKKANPDLDGIDEANKQRNRDQGDLNVDTYDVSTTGGAVPKDVDKASAIALEEADMATYSVEGESLEDLESLNEKQFEGLQAISKDFDNMHADGVQQIKDYTAELVAREAGGDTTDYMPGMLEAVATGINAMTEMRQELKDAGAGPLRLKAVDAKIRQLTALSTATSSKELDSIINSKDIDLDTKVAQIIGSSSASLKHINSVLEDEAAMAELNQMQVDLLELKKTSVSTLYDVTREKLIGGGRFGLGVLQFANQLLKGPNANATEKINNFVASQRSKIATFVSAVEEWDVEQGMPWVVGAKDVNPNIKIMKTWDEDTKAAARSVAVNTSNDIKVMLAGRPYKGVAIVANLAEVMKKEQVELDKLERIANGKTASPKSQKEVKKAPKEDTEVSTSKEDTKALVEAIKITKKGDTTIYSIGGNATAHIVQSDNGDITLSKLFVGADSRGKGLASKLLSKVIENFGDSDILLTADPEVGTLSRLVRLYSRYGFEDNFIEDPTGAEDTSIRNMIRPGEAPKETSKVSTPVETKEAPVEADPIATQDELDETNKELDALDVKIEKAKKKARAKPVNEILSVAKDTESEYNATIRDNVMLLVKSSKGLQQLLAKNNIDMKDC